MKFIVPIVKWLLNQEWFFMAVCEALYYGGLHISRNPRRKEKSNDTSALPTEEKPKETIVFTDCVFKGTSDVVIPLQPTKKEKANV